MSLKEKALKWWNSLATEEQEKIEREFGYCGHDIGITESDVLYFYSEKLKNENYRKS